MEYCDWYGCTVEQNKKDGTEENCSYYGDCDTCDLNIDKQLEEEASE